METVCVLASLQIPNHPHFTFNPPLITCARGDIACAEQKLSAFQSTSITVLDKCIFQYAQTYKGFL